MFQLPGTQEHSYRQGLLPKNQPSHRYIDFPDRRTGTTALEAAIIDEDVILNLSGHRDCMNPMD